MCRNKKKKPVLNSGYLNFCLIRYQVGMFWNKEMLYRYCFSYLPQCVSIGRHIRTVLGYKLVGQFMLQCWAVVVVYCAHLQENTPAVRNASRDTDRSGSGGAGKYVGLYVCVCYPEHKKCPTNFAAWTMHFQSMMKENPMKCIFQSRPYI
jgi:hypothetical protein